MERKKSFFQDMILRPFQNSLIAILSWPEECIDFFVVENGKFPRMDGALDILGSFATGVFLTSSLITGKGSQKQSPAKDVYKKLLIRHKKCPIFHQKYPKRRNDQAQLVFKTMTQTQMKAKSTLGKRSRQIVPESSQKMGDKCHLLIYRHI